MFAWQHGPHRQGLGALFQKVIEPSFRWNSRTESFIVGSVVVAAALCALYLKKRLYGGFSAADIFIPAAFFIPRQFETLFVTANFAHGPFPLLLIVLYCLAWTCSLCTGSHHQFCDDLHWIRPASWVSHPDSERFRLPRKPS
jgi:hypothetical protein